MKTIHRRLRRRWASGGLCPQMPAMGSQVSQKPGGQGHDPSGPPGKRRGQLALRCELTPRPTWRFLCTSRKTGAALTGRKPGLAGSLLWARAGAALGAHSLLQAPAQTRPRREPPSAAPRLPTPGTAPASLPLALGQASSFAATRAAPPGKDPLGLSSAGGARTLGCSSRPRPGSCSYSERNE